MFNSTNINSEYLENVSSYFVEISKTCVNTPEIAPLTLNNNESIIFESQFYCLDIILDFSLDDATDIKCCILKESKAVGVLKKSQQMSLETKVKLFLSIPLNFALWNRETWAENKLELALLDSFYHEVIRRI